MTLAEWFELHNIDPCLVLAVATASFWVLVLKLCDRDERRGRRW